MHPETVLESNDIETVSPTRVGDTVGYARVSTHDQNPDAQHDRFIEAGAIAHFERRLISERTRYGSAAAKRRGKRPGRPPVHPDTVSAAQKLIEAGLAPGEAGKQLGIGRATAYRIAQALY